MEFAMEQPWREKTPWVRENVNWNWCTIPFSEIIIQLLQAPVASILLEGFSFTGQ